MKRKIITKIQRGNLTSYSDLFTSYSPKRKQEILKRARYIRAAIALKKLRGDLKMSQADLARKMKVKRTFIARIESGEQNITLETLHRVAEATGKDFEFRFA